MNLQKERLKDLILSADVSLFGTDKSFADVYADYLLENGVIVPPCKVGDKVYFILEDVLEDTGFYVSDAHIITEVGFRGFWTSGHIPAENDMSCFEFWEALNKTAFLSKEGAEKAFAEKRV
jgi:hypothetical protein